jgi:RHS repeat-associated protein
MRWVLMLFVILAAVMGGEARAVVVMGRVVVSERGGKAETVEERAEALRVESERASRGAVLEVQKAAGLVDAGPLALWFPGGLAVARSDCGDRQAEFSDGTLSLLLARGVDIGGGTRGLLWTARRETGSAENGSAVTLRFNRYNSRGDVVGQSDAAGVTTWAATYQADGRRTGEIGTNLNPKHATGRVRELGVNRDRHRACTKEEDPTGLLNEGFRYRDMETGTFISRDPLGHVDGPNVYCYVRQNPWTAFDPEGLFVKFLQGKVEGGVAFMLARTGLGSAIEDAVVASGHAAVLIENEEAISSTLKTVSNVSGEVGDMLAPVSSDAIEMAAQGNMSELAKELASNKFKVVDKALSAIDAIDAARSGYVIGVLTSGAGPGRSRGHSGGRSPDVTPDRGARPDAADAPGGTRASWTHDQTTVTSNNGECFAAGTPVLTARGARPIEEVGLGDRVLTAEAGGAQDSGTAVMDPASWRAYSLRLTRADGTVTRVDLLRPAGWEQVMTQGPDGRRTIHLELPEMGVSGEAEVLAVSPCPPVEPGVGRVVTGSFRNERNHGLRALHVSVAGEVSCLRVTSGHPVWSVTRGAWIGAGELAAGEALAAWRGEPVAVLANLPEADTATWNLEVENEHVYRVGPAGILVHNTCPTPKELFEGGGGAKTTGQNSAELGRNMAREGRPVEAGDAAAHIVPSTGTKGHWAKGAESRALLERYGVNVNDAANGARLGHPRPHNQTHTGAFQNSTNARLNAVRDSMQEAGRGGKAIRKGLRQELRSIGRELEGQ